MEVAQTFDFLRGSTCRHDQVFPTMGKNFKPEFDQL